MRPAASTSGCWGETALRRASAALCVAASLCSAEVPRRRTLGPARRRTLGPARASAHARPLAHPAPLGELVLDPAQRTLDARGVVLLLGDLRVVDDGLHVRHVDARLALLQVCSDPHA